MMDDVVVSRKHEGAHQFMDLGLTSDGRSPLAPYVTNVCVRG